MSIATEITRINTNIANSYTAVDNKGGTLPATQNSANLATAINSIEVIESATAEGESLSLANTKAMPYNDYVVEGKSEQGGEPSPSNTSEIHSVADDVNLWDGEIISSINATYSNGVVTQTIADTSTERSWKFNAYNNNSFIKNIGKLYKTDLGIVSFSFTKESSFNALSFGLNGSVRDTMITISLSNLKDNENYTLSFNVTNVTQGSISWQDIKLQKGTTATPYSPYNQGTVTIKQRGTTESNDYTFQTEPLRSLPNGVKDTIEADGIHRRVGRIVLDGSETGWYKQDNTSYSQDYLRFTISITDKINAINPNSQKDNILSDKFTNKILDNNATRQSNSITGQYSTNLINIFIAQSIIIGNDVNSFKTWLSTHNTEVLYELAEEIIEPLTQQQATTMLDIIKTGSYEGTTNIYTDEDVKPTIGVGYYKKA